MHFNELTLDQLHAMRDEMRLDLANLNTAIAKRAAKPRPAPAAPIEEGRKDAILSAIAAAEWRVDIRAANWVGEAVANVLGLDVGLRHDAATVKGVIQRLYAAGLIKTVARRDAKSRWLTFVEVA